jgi:hypothetical protein
MPGKPRQFSLRPGEVKDLGVFKDGDETDISVTAQVRSCTEPASAVDINKTENAWAIVVPPDSVTRVDGLMRRGEVVKLYILAGSCVEPHPAALDGFPVGWQDGVAYLRLLPKAESDISDES